MSGTVRNTSRSNNVFEKGYFVDASSRVHHSTVFDEKVHIPQLPYTVYQSEHRTQKCISVKIT